MAVLMTRIRVDDFDLWKRVFDTDPPGARAAATGHRLFRTVGEPNEVSIAVEFDSVGDAEQARAKLLAAGVLDRVEVRVAPTIVEPVGASAPV